MGFLIIKYSTNAAVYATHRNTASDNRCDVSRNTVKGGVKERRISSIYALNFGTKSILSDRAWNLESSGIYFCVFLGFAYKITDKPRIPSDNLDPAYVKSCKNGFIINGDTSR